MRTILPMSISASLPRSASPRTPTGMLTGTVSDIGAVLDPTIRTAKVRIQVQNPGNALRIGMFATATFHGSKAETKVVGSGRGRASPA